MATSSIPVFVCDRCGGREEIRPPSQNDYNWGKLLAAQANGPIWIGKRMPGGGDTLVGMGLDLCPRCLARLKEWWGATD